MKNTGLVSLAVAAIIVLAAVLANAQEPVPDPTQQPAKEIAVFYGMSSGSFDQQLGRVFGGWGVTKTSGYESFFMKRLAEHYDDDGIKHFYLHLPFGKKEAWPMDFDAAPTWSELKADRRLPSLSKTTPENFTFWAGKFLTKYSDTKLTVYLGALDSSPNMVALAGRDLAEYYRRFADSIAPITNLHFQFGVDKSRLAIVGDRLGSSSITKDSLPFLMAKTIKAQGFNIGVEPHFPEGEATEHLLEFPVSVIEEHWRRAHLKNSNKPNFAHVTVLVVKGNESEANLMSLVRNQHVDCIAVNQYVLDDLQRVQREHLAELGN